MVEHCRRRAYGHPVSKRLLRTTGVAPTVLPASGEEAGAVSGAHSTGRLEERAGESGLADNRPKRTDAQFAVVGNWNGTRRRLSALLHDDVAATPTYLLEAVRREDAADLSTREDAQSTQRQRRVG